MNDLDTLHNQSIHQEASNTVSAHFVTLCVRNQESLLGEVVAEQMVLNDLGKMVEEEWLQATHWGDQVDMDAYIIMPNHFHAIVWLGDDKPDAPALPTFVEAFKAAVTHRASQLDGASAAPFWQPGYHERTIRQEGTLLALRRYIQNNPAAWHQDPLNVTSNGLSCLIGPNRAGTNPARE